MTVPKTGAASRPVEPWDSTRLVRGRRDGASAPGPYREGDAGRGRWNKVKALQRLKLTHSRSGKLLGP